MLSRYRSKEVFVVSSSEKLIAYIRENLPDGDYAIAACAAGGTEARQKMMDGHYAVVIVNLPLSDESGTELVSDFAENTPSSVIAVVRAEQEDEMRNYLEPFGVFVLGKPFPHSVFHQTVYDASAAYARLTAVSMENQRLQTKLLDQRVINRAKWALIRYVGMDEDAAHKFIEQQAMNLRISKRTAAENILKTYEHNG